MNNIKPGRCIDCKWVDIYPDEEEDLYFDCERSHFMDSPIRIEFFENEKIEKILIKLRKPCDLILINGEYGFEPVEEEE